VHEGWIMTPSVSVSRALSGRLQISTELSANVVSDQYAQTYFGVTPAGAAVTGLDPFDAEGGLKDVGLSFGWAYAVTDTWSVTGVSSYRRLLSDAADSPLVDRIGDANQFTMGIGIGRSF
jgi:outer membrane scaffolding protein for murein synthesis (MipA/OmpV family)